MFFGFYLRYCCNFSYFSKDLSSLHLCNWYICEGFKALTLEGGKEIEFTEFWFYSQLNSNFKFDFLITLPYVIRKFHYKLHIFFPRIPY